MFSEVGLDGDICPCSRVSVRLREAIKLSFSVALVPKANTPQIPIDSNHVIAVNCIEQAIEEVKALCE